MQKVEQVDIPSLYVNALGWENDTSEVVIKFGEDEEPEEALLYFDRRLGAFYLHHDNNNRAFHTSSPVRTIPSYKYAIPFCSATDLFGMFINRGVEISFNLKSLKRKKEKKLSTKKVIENIVKGRLNSK